MTEFKGDQFGVRIVRRGPQDDHPCIQIISEDDENWSTMGHWFSSYWLEDLIEQLQNAKNFIKRHGKGKTDNIKIASRYFYD